MFLTWPVLFIQFVFLILFVRQITILSLAIWTWRGSEIPYESTQTKALKELMTRIQLKPGQKIYDLGSGNGKVALFLAKQEAITVIGIEKNLILYLTSQFKKAFSFKLKGQVILKHQDLFTVDLSDADLVYTYFVPSVFTKITDKFVAELKTNTLLVAWRYPFKHPAFKLIDQFKARHTMYLYQKQPTKK